MHTNKLRIGVLLENYKKEIGGAHSYYNTLIEGIADYSFDESLEFVFVCIGSTIDPFAPSKSYLFDIEKIMKRKHPFLYLINAICWLKGISYLPLAIKIQESYTKQFNEEIRKKLIEHQIDIFYALTPYYNDLDYPTVVTHWDIGHKSTFAFPEVTFDGEYESREAFYKKYLQKAFAIICESEAGKKELCLLKNINPERMFVVPMFPGGIINLDVSQSEQECLLEKFSVSKNEFFMYPAQFWAHKNHYNLVLAFKRFSQKYPSVKLLLPGSDKGNLKYIKEVVKQLGLEDRVIFAGFVSNEELYAFYKNAIALVMPTMLGPTNMPLLEAQALGCKVICSDFPGHRESLGEQVIYIDPTDAEVIALSMENSYLNRNNDTADSNEIKTIEQALKQVNSIFNKLKVIRKTFD